MLNSDHIETVEAHPHTVIKLTNSKTLLVQESPEEIVKQIVAFRSRVFRCGDLHILQLDPSVKGMAEPAGESG